MQATRRFWGLALGGGFLSAFAVLVDRPVLLVGPTLLGAVLLARQWAFLRAIRGLQDGLDLTQSLSAERVQVGRDLDLTLSARSHDDAPHAVELWIGPSPPLLAASTDAEDQLHLGAGATAAETVLTYDTPVAGRGRFEQPTVEAIERSGLFTQSFTAGEAAAVTVESAAPTDVHVGAGGERVAGTFGEHRSDARGEGITPADVRPAEQLESVRRIDWKVTARMGEAHVRDYEVESDQQTVLLVDARRRLLTGDRPALPYLRTVVLSYLQAARHHDDRLGCYVVDDDGLRDRFRPTAGEYGAIHRALLDLGADDSPSSGDAAPSPAVEFEGRPTRSVTPAQRQSVGDRLGDDASPFGTTLRAYVADHGAHVERFAADPLFGTARRELAQLGGETRTVVVTDDADPATVRETVSLLARGDRTVDVYLAPTVLYEDTGVIDLEAAYDRYVAFEEFRRDLDGRRGVTAFEVAPGDALETIRSVGRRRRRASVEVQR